MLLVTANEKLLGATALGKIHAYLCGQPSFLPDSAVLDAGEARRWSWSLKGLQAD